MDPTTPEAKPEATGAVAATTTPRTGLHLGALGLPEIVMQGIAHTAPATAILLTLPFIASHAGLAAPLAYLIALLIVLMLGVGLSQLAEANAVRWGLLHLREPDRGPPRRFPDRLALLPLLGDNPRVQPGDDGLGARVGAEGRVWNVVPVVAVPHPRGVIHILGDLPPDRGLGRGADGPGLSWRWASSSCWPVGA